VPRLGGALNPSGTPAMPQSGVQRAVPGGSSLSLSGGPSAPVASPALGVGSAGSSQPGGGFGSLTQGYGQTFQAPTDITEQNDPGYQARMKFGTDAIQRSAAARGGVLTGGTAKALGQFGQDYASMSTATSTTAHSKPTARTTAYGTTTTTTSSVAF
jgi:hypothetical protein